MNNLKSITVNASKSYQVLIADGIIKDTGSLIEKIVNKGKIAIITDDIVNGLYGEIVENSLKKVGRDYVKFVFKNGEQSKNLNVYGEILSFLATNEMTRTDLIIALGGGVVGDMAGFAAATYLRGIKYVQIPTTLLSQIDSSVGGKTAIDLKEGKNLVGAFCQPELVICDTGVMQSLPRDIYLDGMGEMVKYAILDKKIFELITSDKCDINQLVYLAIDYKRQVVEKDEFESGLRKVLNLGHTPAHGIEKLSNYNVPHGKAVSMGLNIILNASLKHGFIDDAKYQKMSSMIEKTVGKLECDFKVGDIAEVALKDKKRSGDSISLIMVEDIGQVREEKVKVTRLKEYLF